MATEFNLKHCYRDIDAKADEVERYRAELAARLSAQHNDDNPHVSPPTVHSLRSRLWTKHLAMAATLVFCMIGFIGYLSMPEFPQQEFDEIQALLASSDLVSLQQRALRQNEGSSMNALNANMILSLTQDTEQAIEGAFRGLEFDPRPEFRREYLELLLDRSEEVIFNANYLEGPMEQERDEVCLMLYRLLLKTA